MGYIAAKCRSLGQTLKKNLVNTLRPFYFTQSSQNVSLYGQIREKPCEHQEAIWSPTVTVQDLDHTLYRLTCSYMLI